MEPKVVTVADIDHLMQRYSVTNEHGREIGRKSDGMHLKPKYNSRGRRSGQWYWKDEVMQYKSTPPWMKREVIQIRYCDGLTVVTRGE